MKFNKLCCLVVSVLIVFSFYACKTKPSGNIEFIDSTPSIYPDYAGVTIPQNIAPLNFKVNEKGTFFWVKASSPGGISINLKSSDGITRFPLKKWKKMVNDAKGNKIDIEIFAKKSNGKWAKYNNIEINVANEPIDQFLAYRLLYPGYEGWYELSIVQRNLENFKEHSILENQMVDHNCINCHSFCNNNPEKGLFHVRGNVGGTYFIDGENLTKTNLKTAGMEAGAVYPSWHPSGHFVAFASNKVTQSFHAKSPKNIEVYDLASSLVLYDTQANKMHPVTNTDTIKYMETFPTWSPDGNYLYYCRTSQVDEYFDIKEVRYDLLRRKFNSETLQLGEPEMVFDANKAGKSVSFPRISPDGKFLVYTLFDYGIFSIWHKEADLYLLNLQTGETGLMEVNSKDTESYHSWSFNSRWLVFSSKRGDGLTARPYIAYVYPNGETTKPFVLPQKDPDLYLRMLKTFNIPELIKGKVEVDTRQISKAARKVPLQAKE